MKCFLLIALSCALQVACQEGPCTPGGHITLNHPKRRIDYITAEQEMPTCDKDIFHPNKWYRFLSGEADRLAEGCVPVKRCGTYGPIWLDEPHPEVSEGVVSRRVCAYYGTPADCCTCSWSADIRVLACDTEEDIFYVYKLANPEGCYVGYCISEPDQNQCPDNEVPIIVNGTTICIEEPPDMHNVEISDPYVDKSTRVFVIDDPLIGEWRNISMNVSHFVMRCDLEASFSHAICESQIGFDVEVTVDGETVDLPSLKTTGLEPYVIIDEKYLYGNLGKEVGCRARAYWLKFEGREEFWSPAMNSSTTYWAGINQKVHIDSQMVPTPPEDDRIIEFQSTLPLTFWHLTEHPELRYTVLDAKFTSKEGLATRCQTTINKYAVSNITVEIDPNLPDGVHNFELEFEPFKFRKFADFPSLFENYRMDNIRIQVTKEKPYSHCASFEEPSIQTFEGDRYVIYDLIGDFYMWQDKRREAIFEVQTRQFLCFGESGTCNCGVAAREGNSIVILDMCDNQFAMPVLALQESAGHALPIVSYVDGIHKIIFPSGKRLEVKIVMDFLNRLNIYLEVPKEDVNTDGWGFCQEPSQENVYKHRVPREESLFDVQNIMCVDTSEMPVRLCSCDGTVIVCDGGNVLTTGLTCNPGRKKRSILTSDNGIVSDDYISIEELQYEFEYSEDNTVGDLTWPTESGRTEAEVTDLCEDKLMSSPVWDHCHKIIDVSNVIGACISDVQITDDIRFIDPKVDVLEDMCSQAVRRMTYVTPDDGMDYDIPDGYVSVSEAEDITQDICPLRCSHHGTCHNGMCSCFEGYTGVDCAISTTEGPTLGTLQQNGLCDIRKRACNHTRVYGSNIPASSDLKCKWEMGQGVSRTEIGRILTPGVAKCGHDFSNVLLHSATTSPATHQTLELSLSNDAIIYSNKVKLTIYDSLCMSCSTEHVCQQTENACNIEGRCYSDKDLNPAHPCLYCDVTKSTNFWSVLDTKACENTTVNTPSWSKWGEWGDCSTTHCLQTRSRNCSTGNEKDCEGHATDVQWCISCTAKEIADEMPEGVKFTVSRTDINQALINLPSMRSAFAKSVNKYCANNRDECCGVISIESETTGHMNLTSWEFVHFAQGFPQFMTEEVSLKWLVNVWKEGAIDTCQGTRRFKRDSGSNTLPVPSSIIYKAVVNNAEYLEEELGVEILDIQETSSPSASINLKLILSVTLACVALVIVCVAAYVIKTRTGFCKNERRTEPEKEQNDQKPKLSTSDQVVSSVNHAMDVTKVPLPSYEEAGAPAITGQLINNYTTGPKLPRYEVA